MRCSSPAWAEVFAQAVDAAIACILEFPNACPAVHRGARRYLIERFPYCLYYRIEGDGVIVVALMHAARDPERHGRRSRG